MIVLRWIALLFAGLGHLGLWSAVYNQLHATALPRGVRKVLEKLIYLVVIVLGLAVLGQAIFPAWIATNFGANVGRLLEGYFVLCLLAAVFLIGRWAMYQSRSAREERLTEHENHVVDLRKEFPGPHAHGLQARLLDRIPGNQNWELAIEKKSLVFHRLPRSLHELTLLHISDLHFTGRIDRSFFDMAVEYANFLQPDIVCLTGDIIDSARCWDWIEPVLGKLQAKRAKYFILGNHDRRVRDTRRLRQEVEQLGFIDLGQGTWHPLSRSIKPGETVWFAGNELPWFQGARQLEYAFGRPPDGAMKILLSHSPDQFSWALKRDFDLVLAGHTHGGQIRFPFIGPVICPSRYGVKYALGNGIFRSGKSILHVNRGLSGDQPIRINCRPEISLITLLRDKTPQPDSANIDES